MSNIVRCLKFGFAASFNAFFLPLTNLKFTRFLMFFMVFSEDGVVHHLDEIFLEVILLFRSQLRVELNAALKSRLLFKTLYESFRSSNQFRDIV